MPTIGEFVSMALEHSATDIYFNPNTPPWLRIDGAMHLLQDHPLLDGEEIETLARQVLPRLAAGPLPENAVGAVSLDGLCRLRVTLFTGNEGPSLSCRLISATVPDFQVLGLPRVLKKLATEPHGLLLLVGRAGSGKSSTLAALIDYINHHFQKSIVSIETPVEYVHNNKMSFIEQIPYHHTDARFDRIWHAGYLQTADVIAIDGLTPDEMISPALAAAAEGCLVMATLESNGGSAEVLEQVIHMESAARRDSRRLLLAATLRGVVWQHLFRRKTGERVQPAFEVLLNDQVISGLIGQPGRLHLIRPTMAAGRFKGMQTMRQALSELKAASDAHEGEIHAFERAMLAHYVRPVTARF